MIIRIFKESHPVSFIVAPVFVLLFLLVSWQGAGEYIVRNPMPLYDLVVASFSGLPEWISGLVVFLILVSQVFHLNHVIGKHEVLYKNSYLPALIYMILIVMIPQFMALHPVLLVNSILIFILDKLFRLYKNPVTLPLIFDLFFLGGVATLIYLPAIALFVLYVIAILILKPFSWRDWPVGLTGFLLPFFFAFLYFFWVDALPELQNRFMLDDISQYWDPEGMMLRGYRITIGLVAVIILLSIIRIRQNFYKNSNRVRSYQQVIFLFLMVGLLTLAVTGSASVYRFAIVTIPVSIMVSYYFLSSKKSWWSELVFWVMIATLILNHWSVGR
jgi:hypothetical protein